MNLLNIAQIVCLVIIGGVVSILTKGIVNPLYWIVMGAVMVYGFLSWFEGRHQNDPTPSGS